MVFAIAACSKPAPPEVTVWGALRELIHEGRVEGRVELATVVHPGTYAVGALEGMRGEVTVIDGAAWLAVGERDGGRAKVGLSGERAALLVAANVSAWRDIPIETAIAVADLDARIEGYAVSAGVATDKPFPFVIEGDVDATWHVLKGPPAPGANPHDHARNAVVGKLAGPAIVVGFFSKHHVGVFTHMGHTVHAHVIDRRAAVGGHADELAVRAGATLRLPR